MPRLPVRQPVTELSIAELAIYSMHAQRLGHAASHEAACTVLGILTCNLASYVQQRCRKPYLEAHNIGNI